MATPRCTGSKAKATKLIQQGRPLFPEGNGPVITSSPRRLSLACGPKANGRGTLS